MTENELEILSDKIIDFYENTSNYELNFKVKWNPFFKFFGLLVQVLFSKRINQLYLLKLKTFKNKNEKKINPKHNN